MHLQVSICTLISFWIKVGIMEKKVYETAAGNSLTNHPLSKLCVTCSQNLLVEKNTFLSATTRNLWRLQVYKSGYYILWVWVCNAQIKYINWDIENKTDIWSIRTLCFQYISLDEILFTWNAMPYDLKYVIVHQLHEKWRIILSCTLFKSAATLSLMKLCFCTVFQ